MKTLRVKGVSEKTSLAVSTIWKYTKLGEFPQPKKMSMRCTVWLESDIDAWIAKQLGVAS